MALLNVREQPGFRLMQGETIDAIIDAVNGLAAGTSPFDKIQIGATATTALIFGAGTNAVPYDMGTTANQNMMGVWGKVAATTGDSRLSYQRLYFNGAGGSGECQRVFSTVNNVQAAVGGTVNGQHVSLSLTGASASISGAGNAQRLTFGQGAGVNAGGTCAVQQLDSDLDATATVAATLAYQRFTNSNSKKVPILWNLDGVDTTTLYIAAGTGAGSAGNATHCAAQKVLTILVNGASAYIPVFTQNS